MMDYNLEDLINEFENDILVKKYNKYLNFLINKIFFYQITFIINYIIITTFIITQLLHNYYIIISFL
ncbi:hypothetical protein Glove_41g139 [Diversispora epigaea]|uniref:Uncharacterized protein n=1 Tax=Diversispora epigaea TaxID=1348612 RepID=A0A397JJR8_9GLOM|nr:hypothetical protein Glove_41g139 [Diversispora epigaea]